MTSFLKKNFELLFWIAAIIIFAFFTNPATAQHFSLCIFKALGFDACMGCGVGRAMSFALQGDFSASWQMHFMGIPALFIIFFRVGTLVRITWF